MWPNRNILTSHPNVYSWILSLYKSTSLKNKKDTGLIWHPETTTVEVRWQLPTCQKLKRRHRSVWHYTDLNYTGIYWNLTPSSQVMTFHQCELFSCGSSHRFGICKIAHTVHRYMASPRCVSSCVLTTHCLPWNISHRFCRGTAFHQCVLFSCGLLNEHVV